MSVASTTRWLMFLWGLIENTFTSHQGVGFEEMARAQAGDPNLATEKSSFSHKLEDVPLLALTIKIICNTSTGVPQRLCHSIVFSSLYSLSHPGVKATSHMATTLYHWPCMKADIRMHMGRVLPSMPKFSIVGWWHVVSDAEDLQGSRRSVVIL